jgi:branched-chain amino acid transport system substrate-binding protein
VNWIAWSLLPLLLALQSDRTPYKPPRQQPQEYNGPGHEEADPEGLKEILIGYFGPGDPKHPEGGMFWMGASLAMEEANREGGYKGLSFRLVPGWSENPWSGGPSRVVRMAYVDRVWAVIGSIDGTATHLAEQVVAKALLPLVDPGSTDSTVNQANVPWVFSCAPSDRTICRVLLKGLVDSATQKSFAVISATDHDSRALSTEFSALLRKSFISPLYQFDSQGVVPEIPVGVKAVVILAGVRDSVRILGQVRRERKDLIAFGGPAFGRQVLLSQAEGVRCPVMLEPAEAYRLFVLHFAERWQTAPDFAAVFAYDAACLTVAAVRKGGLNRARIRDALQGLSGWQGASGAVRWDASGRNNREVRLGTITNGRLE